MTLPFFLASLDESCHRCLGDFQIASLMSNCISTKIGSTLGALSSNALPLETASSASLSNSSIFPLTLTSLAKTTVGQAMNLSPRSNDDSGHCTFGGVLNRTTSPTAWPAL